jgi:hypothetical protein
MLDWRNVCERKRSCLEVVSRDFPGETEETHGNLHSAQLVSLPEFDPNTSRVTDVLAARFDRQEMNSVLLPVRMVSKAVTGICNCCSRVPG